MKIQGSGFRVQGSGFRVQGSGFRVQGSGFRVQGSAFRVQGSGFRIDQIPGACAVAAPLLPLHASTEEEGIGPLPSEAETASNVSKEFT